MGEFVSGHVKAGGRKRGAPNRRTEILRDVLERLGCDVPQRLVALLPQLAPDSQARVLMELMSFLYPRRKAVELVPASIGFSVEQTRNFFFNITSDPETMKAAEFVAERIASGEKSQSTR